MSKNKFELGRTVAKARRSSDTIDKEVYSIVREMGNPVRWRVLESEAKQKGIAPNVLNVSLKRLRDKKIIGTMVIDDEKGNPCVHYHLVDPHPSEYSREIYDVFGAFGEKISKGTPAEKKGYLTKSLFYSASLIQNAQLFALNAALKCASYDEAMEKFGFIFSSIVSDAAVSNAAIQLRNVEASKEVVDEAKKNFDAHIKQLVKAIKTNPHKNRGKGH